MSRYNIETAKSAGFCFGVKRAVEIAEKAAEENGSCYTLGELIHNGSEIARLQKLGVYPIDSPDDLPQDAYNPLSRRCKIGNGLYTRQGHKLY